MKLRIDKIKKNVPVIVNTEIFGCRIEGIILVVIYNVVKIIDMHYNFYFFKTI